MSSHGRRAGPTRDDPGQAPGVPAPKASDDATAGAAGPRTSRRSPGRATGSGGRHAARPRPPASDPPAADGQVPSSAGRPPEDRTSGRRVPGDRMPDDASGQTWQLPAPGGYHEAEYPATRDRAHRAGSGQWPDDGEQRGRGYGPDPSRLSGPSHQPGWAHQPDPGHQPDWTSQPARGSRQDEGYQPDPRYAPGEGYQPDPRYAPGEGYQPDPGHGPDASYRPDPGRLADPRHQLHGTGQPAQGYRPDPGQRHDPGYPSGYPKPADQGFADQQRSDQGSWASRGPLDGQRYPPAGYRQDMGPRQDPAGYPRDPELAPDLGYRQDQRRQSQQGPGYPGHGYPPDQGGQLTQPGYRQDYGYPPDQGGQLTQPGYPQGYRNPDENGYPWPAQSYPSGSPAADPETAPDLETVPAPATAPPGGGPSLARSSTVMALGTVASRLTGFLRTVVQVAALGTLHLADAYNNANTLPNVVYNLALGGILTSVIVPLLVNAAKRDADHGEAYDQRMFTLGTMALLGVTVIATAAAVPLVYLYKGPIQGAELHILVIFAYFFIPQIFFYGVSSLAGAVLNARGHFAAPMWTPVVNNIVVIVVLLLFTVIAAKNTGPATITTGEVQLLGWGTTLGIVAQTAALLPALRRVGFRWRPRFDFRRAEVGEIRRMAGWMAGYVAATQAAFLVTSIVANTAGVAAGKAHTGYGAGFSAYTYGWLLFQLPYAVVGISVITALLPRMSAHATERRYAAVREDFSTGVRLSSVIVAPSALILAVLGAPLALVLFAHGRTGAADARYIGEVFAVFCLGLVPYMLFQLQLRVFYALHDSRTPALIGFGTATVNIITNLIALQVLPARQVVAGLGVGFGLANVFGTAVAWYILSRRLGGLDGRIIGGSLLRMHAAAVPPAIFALAVSIMVGAILSHGRLGALVTVALAGAGALLLYVLFAKALGVSEVTDLTGSVRARLRR